MAGYKAQGNITCTYNGQALTNYVNQVDLSSKLQQIDATTLGDTGKVNIVDAAEWTVELSGLLESTPDNILAPDAVTPGTKRTFSVVYTVGSSTITYTWTNAAMISDWQIKSSVGGLQEWSATLTLSGAPTRTVA